MDIKRFNERVSEIFTENPDRKIEFIAVLHDRERIKFENYLVKRGKIELACSMAGKRFSTWVRRRQVEAQQIRNIDYLIIE